MSKTKSLSGVAVKSAEKGEVTAVFSTFNVVDKDRDVTVPGAFTDGAEVRISAYNHRTWDGALPVGKGRIRQTDSEAILEGKFFLDTEAGRDTFRVVKEMGDLQEWSYGFDILEADQAHQDGMPVQVLKKLAVHEVSPVLLGAGIGTRTVSAKGRKMSDDVTYSAGIRPHTSSMTDRTWEPADVVAGVAKDASVSDLRSVFAWVNPQGDPELKASYRFPHHHGVNGPANLRAVYSCIASLNGARGDAGLSEADRKAVYEHLAGHLRDADREPPELREANSATLKLQDDLISVMAEVERVIDRASEVRALRAQKGKSISPVSVEVLTWMRDEWARLGRELKGLLDTPREIAAAELARGIATDFRRKSS